MEKVILYRTVKRKERFYQVSIHKNLFNEYVLEKVFGSTNYSKCVGRKINIFSNYYIAHIEYMKVVRKKLKKGYIQKLRS